MITACFLFTLMDGKDKKMIGEPNADGAWSSVDYTIDYVSGDEEYVFDDGSYFVPGGGEENV